MVGDVRGGLSGLNWLKIERQKNQIKFEPYWRAQKHSSSFNLSCYGNVLKLRPPLAFQIKDS